MTTLTALQEKMREKLLNLIRNYAGEGNDKFVNKVLVLISASYKQGLKDGKLKVIKYNDKR